MNKSDQLTRLGNILEITSGGTPSRKNSAFFENGSIPWFKTGDLKQRDLFKSDEKITQEALDNSSAKLFPPNTVLVAMYGATIGACGILRVEGAANQACAAFLPSEKALPEFLYYFVNLNKRNFVKMGVGGAQPNISVGKLKNYKIVLPCVQDQQRIVQIINRAESVLKKRRQTLRLTDEFLKSAFLEMFGDPITNTKRWPIKKLEDVVYLQRGYDLPVQDRISGQYPIVASSSIVGCHNEHKVKGPGVVTGRSGTIGKVLYISQDYWPLNTTLFAVDMRGNNPVYLKYFLEFFRLKRFYRGVGVPTLNRNLVHVEKVPSIPVKEQLKFANLVQKVEKLKEKQKQSERYLQNLFNALMQRAFRGELLKEK